MGQTANDRFELMLLASKIDDFLKRIDPYGYEDCECNVGYVTDCLLKQPYKVIEYLMDIVLDYAQAEETASGYVNAINEALDLSKQVYSRV